MSETDKGTPSVTDADIVVGGDSLSVGAALYGKLRGFGVVGIPSAWILDSQNVPPKEGAKLGYDKNSIADHGGELSGKTFGLSSGASNDALNITTAWIRKHKPDGRSDPHLTPDDIQQIKNSPEYAQFMDNVGKEIANSFGKGVSNLAMIGVGDGPEQISLYDDKTKTTTVIGKVAGGLYNALGVNADLKKKVDDYAAAHPEKAQHIRFLGALQGVEIHPGEDGYRQIAGKIRDFSREAPAIAMTKEQLATHAVKMAANAGIIPLPPPFSFDKPTPGSIEDDMVKGAAHFEKYDAAFYPDKRDGVYRHHAYIDADGLPTVDGRHDPTITMQTAFTEEEVAKNFRDDFKKKDDDVRALLKPEPGVAITDRRIGVLDHLAYLTGTGAGGLSEPDHEHAPGVPSRTLQAVNEGWSDEKFATEVMDWVKERNGNFASGYLKRHASSLLNEGGVEPKIVSDAVRATLKKYGQPYDDAAVASIMREADFKNSTNMASAAPSRNDGVLGNVKVATAPAPAGQKKDAAAFGTLDLKTPVYHSHFATIPAGQPYNVAALGVLQDSAVYRSAFDAALHNPVSALAPPAPGTPALAYTAEATRRLGASAHADAPNDDHGRAEVRATDVAVNHPTPHRGHRSDRHLASMEHPHEGRHDIEQADTSPPYHHSKHRDTGRHKSSYRRHFADADVNGQGKESPTLANAGPPPSPIGPTIV